MTKGKNWFEIKRNFAPLISTDTDGTFTPHLGVPVTFEKGYQVSFERPDDTYTPDQYNIVVETLSAVCGQPFVGVWGGDKEISFHIYDLTFATKLGKFFGQDAIWDWSNKEAITL